MIDPIFTDAISCELVKQCASDLDVVNAARISVDIEHEIFDISDEKLIPYLLGHKHGSPFEHGMFKFRVVAPIFCFREHHRHRAGHSYNEMSGRYTELEPRFYVPRTARTQEGKPGHYVYVERAEDDELTRFMRNEVGYSYRVAWAAYQRMLRNGVAKEQARIVLPVGIYSKMIWTCNPRSLMHFLGLRNAPTAMAEIQTVAQAAEAALAEHMPHTYAAFIANERTAP